MTTYQNLKDQALATLNHVENLVTNSPEFNSDPITVEQRQYTEPFGLDKMAISQWLLHIYLPVAKNHIQYDEFMIFANLKDFSYVFEHSFQQKSHPDVVELIRHLRDFEEVMPQLIAAKPKR